MAIISALVKPSINGLEFIGIIGSDTALDSLKPAYKESLSIFMQGIKISDQYKMNTRGTITAIPVTKFIVAQRDDDDITPLHYKFGDRSIIAVIKSKKQSGLSSTTVKRALREQQSINTLVPKAVKKIIEKKKLYQSLMDKT